MFLEHAFDDGLPLIHGLFLRQVAHSSAATHIDSCITRPLHSVKSLAQWVLRAASSTSPLPALKALSQPQGDATLLSKTPITRPKDASGIAPVIIVYLASSGQLSRADCEGTREGTIFLFLTVDKKGFVSLLGSIHIQASFPLFECSPRRLTFHGAKSRFFSTSRPYRLGIIISILATNQPGPMSPPRFLGYHFCRALKSAFGFLKYSGPRQLVASRKILLDQDGYQITHIGQGAFATISRVLHKPTGDVRVMKRITFDKKGLAKYLVNNEVDTLKAMEGNHWFPRLLNHFSEGGQFVVTMPFYSRGDLSALLEHKGYLGRELAKFYSAQLVLAIQSLHKQGIIHRDIKTDNIFLDDAGHLILADLGLAEDIATFEGGETIVAGYSLWLEARARNEDDFPFLFVSEDNPLRTTGAAGTFWYTAPEVFRTEQYSFGVDYWSVGVIYHELVTGHIPFNHYKPYPENKRPMLDFRIKPGQFKNITAWEQDAISEMLAPNPKHRPQTLIEIKHSRLFSGVDWEKMSRKEISPPCLPPPLHEG